MLERWRLQTTWIVTSSRRPPFERLLGPCRLAQGDIEVLDEGHRLAHRLRTTLYGGDEALPIRAHIPRHSPRGRAHGEQRQRLSDLRRHAEADPRRHHV